jgi:hypothetical protein
MDMKYYILKFVLRGETFFEFIKDVGSDGSLHRFLRPYVRSSAINTRIVDSE